MYAYIARICTSFIDVPGKTAVAVYFSGCSIRCKDCQNKTLWDKESGEKMSVDDIFARIKNHPLAQAVVFLGGEPTDQVDLLILLCERIKKECEKEVVLYTGREFEVLSDELLKNLDLVVCGPYKKEFHVNKWPASSNQRVFVKDGLKWTN